MAPGGYYTNSDWGQISSNTIDAGIQRLNAAQKEMDRKMREYEEHVRRQQHQMYYQQAPQYAYGNGSYAGSPSAGSGVTTHYGAGAGGGGGAMTNPYYVIKSDWGNDVAYVPSPGHGVKVVRDDSSPWGWRQDLTDEEKEDVRIHKASIVDHKKKRSENIRKLFWYRFLQTGKLPFTGEVVAT